MVKICMWEHHKSRRAELAQSSSLLGKGCNMINLVHKLYCVEICYAMVPVLGKQRPLILIRSRFIAFSAKQAGIQDRNTKVSFINTYLSLSLLH